MFRHALILGPAFGGPAKTDEVVATARLLAALKKADVRTTLITSVDAAAPMGTLAADQTIVAAYDAASVVEELDRIGPDSLFWIPGGGHARGVVSAIEQSGVFQESGIALFPRPERLRRLEDPDLLAQIVRPLGLSVPPHRVVADTAQLRAAVKVLGLPCSLRPLLPSSATGYVPLRDESDMVAACDAFDSHHHWIARQTSQRGLVVDVLVFADEGGRTKVVGVVRHCEPWLADWGASSLCSSPELTVRPDVARLAEHAEQLATVLQLPGLLTVRLSADIDTESCAVLDVFATAGPACWLAELATGGPLYDLGVLLQLGRSLSAIQTARPSTVSSPSLLGLPRVTQATATQVSAEYSWFSGSTPHGALECALASAAEFQASGGRASQHSRAEDHRRLVGVEFWTAAIAMVASGATPDEAGERCGLAQDLIDAFLSAPRNTSWPGGQPTPNIESASIGAKGGRAALMTAPRALLGVDELWAAAQAAATLGSDGDRPVLATSSLSLAALLRPLDVPIWTTRAAGDLNPHVSEIRPDAALLLPGGDYSPVAALMAYGLAGLHVAPSVAAVRRSVVERGRGSVDLSSVPHVTRRRATNIDDAIGLADQHGWPVHACHGPAGASGEAVLSCAEALQRYCRHVAIGTERPVFVASVPRDARVLDVELLCRRGHIVLMAWSESLQSLEARTSMALDVMPPQRTYPELLRRGRAVVTQVAALLEADGPLSVRLLVTEHEVRLLTTSPGTPRQWPRVSRALGVDWAGAWAALATHGEAAVIGATREAEHVSLSLRRRIPQEHGTERGSTLHGSMTMLGDDADQLLLGVLRASGLKHTVRTAWLSATAPEDRVRLIHAARLLRTAGVRLYATEASAACLRMNDVEVTTLAADDSRWTLTQLRRRIDLMVAVIGQSATPGEAGRLLRLAQLTAIPLIEDLNLLQRLAGALVRHTPAQGAVRSWSEFPRQVEQWA